MYKLVASDLDETLLDENHEIPQRVIDAVSRAAELGVRFAPATGRPFGSVDGVLKTLGLYGNPDDYVISFNGGCLTRNSEGTPLTTCSLTNETAETIYQAGRSYGVCMHVYTLDVVYLYNYSDEERKYIEGRMNIVETFEESLEFLGGEPVVKIVFMMRDLDYLHRIEAEMAKAGTTAGLDVCYSGDRYLEFNAPGINKGAGLAALAERLGIPMDEVIAVGDNSNDVSMLKAAGMGCAVANATDEAKAAADYVCEADNNAGGVAEAIEKFILNA